MTVERQITIIPANQFRRSGDSRFIEPTRACRTPHGIPTRTKRINVPGGKAAVIFDNTSGEIKGIGGMGFFWEEEVDRTRFVKLFLDGIKQAAGLSKPGIQVFELVYHEMRANPGRDEIKLNQYCRQGSQHQRTARISAACVNCWKRNSCTAVRVTVCSSSTSGSCSTGIAWPS